MLNAFYLAVFSAGACYCFLFIFLYNHLGAENLRPPARKAYAFPILLLSRANKVPALPYSNATNISFFSSILRSLSKSSLNLVIDRFLKQ